tara:strand:- start:12792 stop:13265 length:474 start_codon:yes stop_codon:yes gene_type:complete
LSITNTQLLQEIDVLITNQRARDKEFQDWLSGEAGGGTDSDGKYPLTDWLGTTRQTKSPAQLEADVEGLVSSASTYADAAEASATSAAASLASITTIETTVSNHVDAALEHRNDARTARDAAQTYAANAEGYRDSTISLRDEVQDLRDEVCAATGNC